MFGRLIVEARNRKGWTQEETAGKLGTSRGHFAKIEIEGEFPGITLINKIAEILGIDRYQLFDAITKDKKEKEQAKLRQKIKEPRADYSNLPNKVRFLIKKHPEIVEALNDPVALKVFLAVHKTSSDIKETCKAILEALPSMPEKKRKAILTLIEGME